MNDSDFSVSLAVLRLIRGWNQEELSRRSGVRNSSISDYERGKMLPGVGTLERLLGAMGYPYSALDHARALIATLRADQDLHRAAHLSSDEDAGSSDGPQSTPQRSRLPLATPQAWEIEQASIEAGRLATRMTRIFFSLVGSERSGRPPLEARDQPPSATQGERTDSGEA